MDKKAQAGIIVTVLIILLVLATITVFWNIFDSAVRDSAEDANIDPLKLNAEIKSFEVFAGETSSQVSVKREAGVGEIDGIKLVFEDSNGDTYFYDNLTHIPKELEELDYAVSNNSLNIVNFSNIKSVSVYFLFKDKLTRSLDVETKQNKF